MRVISVKDSLRTGILILVSCATYAQTLFMNPVKYTDRKLEVYQSNCGDPSGYSFYISGVLIPSDRISPIFSVGGYYVFELEFGLMKPGDTFRVTDNCGGTAFEQTVKDDYVYVEIPSAASHTGNGIGPNDEYAPYTKLSTPLETGKCEPLTIGSHGLVSYYFFTPQTNGTFSVNGSPLTNQPSAINPSGYDINFNGYQGTPVYAINPDGSITSNCSVKLESNTHYSGSIPLSLEYAHGGENPQGDISFGFKALAFREISNSGFAIEKASLGGVLNRTAYPASPDATYKITYDGTYYKAYVDDILVDELRRFVQYDVSSGTLTPGAATGLDYGQQATWSGMTSGPQWVSVLVDGVLYTRQQFSVAEDIVITPTVIDVACSGGTTGQISIGLSGGKGPFQYALNSGAYQGTAVFSGLGAGSYTIRVRDASGCVATRVVPVGSNAPLAVSVASRTDVGCAGEATGQVQLSATGGDGDYTYSRDGSNFVTTSLFSGLSAGTYVFYAKDGSGCQVPVADTIRSNGNIVASIASVQWVSCPGYSDGGFTVSTAGSVFTGPVRYSADNGATFQSSQVFTGLPAGSYSVQVRDDVCSALLNVVITQPDPLDLFQSVVSNVSCYGETNGQIRAFNVRGGTVPYQFSLDGASFQSDSVFSGLATGHFKITVKDANGCVKESAILEVTGPSPLSLGISSKTDVSCFGSGNGSVSLSGSGGTSPYSFSSDSLTFRSDGIISSLSAGAYRFHIRDANNCRTAISGEILQPAAIQVSATALSAATCFEGTDGQIQAVASGGTGSLSYAIDGTSFGTATTFPGLSAGVYTVTVKDNNGCLKESEEVIINQPARIVPVLTITHVSCFGGNDGNVTIAATGGTGALTYAIEGGGSLDTGVFAGLVANLYRFTITDGHNCAVDTSALVNQPPALAGSSQIVSNLLCHNDSSGVVAATITGGVAPYTYSTDGVTFQSAPTLGILHARTYKVTARDRNGCLFETAPVTLTQPDVLTLQAVSQTAVNCFSGSDGTVSLVASGGTAPYLYAHDTGSYGSAPDFSGLTAGSQDFKVKDGNGCLRQLSVQVVQPAAAYRIELETVADLTCYGSGTGSITVRNSGGTAPYQVSLDNSAFQPGTIFPDLQAGTYSVFGKDAHNCTFTISDISLSQPADITVSLLHKLDVDCEEYRHGEALVGATGSYGRFSYELTGFDFKFNPVGAQSNMTGLFQNLLAGDYTVKARDQAGCTKDFPVIVIAKNTAIRFEVSKTLPADCNSATGAITVLNPTGGRPPYQYSISSLHAFTDQPSFTGLLNGNYIVTVADDLCSYKQDVDLSVPGGIKAAYTLSPVDCSTPVANLSIGPVTGGNGNYSFALNQEPFTSGNSYNGLHPSVYSITIRDNPQSCQTVLGIEIKEQNRADLQVTSLQNVLCHSGNSGMITVKGDNNVGPFKFAINNGAFADAATFSGLTAGTYHVYAQNRIGCTDSLRITLSEPALLVPGFSKQDNNCYGDTTGSIQLTATGGIPGYRYSLNGADYQDNALFPQLTAGAYTAYVKDRNDCISTRPVTLVQPELLQLSAVYSDTVRCFDEKNGRVSLSAKGGTPAYSFSANGTDFVSSPDFSGLPAGAYTYFAKDEKGCRAQTAIILTGPEKLTMLDIEKTDPLCFQSSDGTLLVKTAGGNGGNLYTVGNQPGSGSPLIGQLPEASYIVKVTDRKGCTVESETISLRWPEKISTVLSTVQPLCYGDANGKLSLAVSGGTPGYRALFAGQSYSLQGNGFDFKNIRSGGYRITITDAHGCTENVEGILGEPTALQARLTITGNDCFGDETGKIEVSASGATAAYQYALNDSPFRSSGLFGGLTAGSYRIKVRDTNGCLLESPAEVMQPTAVSLLALNTDTVRCYGEKNGTVRLLATGGTPGYAYSADGMQFYSEPDIRNLGAGNYRFWVRDSKQCEKTVTLTIGQPDVLKLALTGRKDPLCAGEANGLVSIAASGGNGAYVYWRDNAVSQASGEFTGLTESTYTFKAEDRKGCSDAISSVKLTWPQPLTSALRIVQPVCEGESSGEVVVTAAGGTAPYQVMAEGLTPQAPAGNGEWKYTRMAPGSYWFRTRDAHGCMTVSTAGILPAEGFLPVSFPEPEPVCQGQEVILAAGNPGKSTRWFLNGTELNDLRNDQTVTVSDPGEYRLVIGNATGCVSEHTHTLVNSNQALKADFLMTIQAFEGDTVTVLDISRPVPDEITWQVPAEAEVIREINGILAFAIQNEGEYKVTLRARKGECYNTKVRTIRIFDREDIDQTDPALHYEEMNLVQEMTVYPNPNFGEFKVDVKLTKATDAVLSIVRSSNSVEVYREEKKGSREYTFDIQFSNHIQDVYIVTIQSGKSVMYRRVVVMN